MFFTADAIVEELLFIVVNDKHVRQCMSISACFLLLWLRVDAMNPMICQERKKGCSSWKTVWNNGLHKQSTYPTQTLYCRVVLSLNNIHVLLKLQLVCYYRRPCKCWWTGNGAWSTAISGNLEPDRWALSLWLDFSSLRYPRFILIAIRLPCSCSVSRWQHNFLLMANGQIYAVGFWPSYWLAIV